MLTIIYLNNVVVVEVSKPGKRGPSVYGPGSRAQTFRFMDDNGHVTEITAFLRDEATLAAPHTVEECSATPTTATPPPKE